jgi:hypothetical protein
MKKILIAAASALVLAAGSAGANDKPDKSSDNKPATDTSKGADSKTPSKGKSVSGDVQSVDVPAMAITVVSPTGDVQHIVVAADAPITRDGTTASLDQVKPGDNVRASLDSSSDKASRIEVKSKGKTTPAK